MLRFQEKLITRVPGHRLAWDVRFFLWPITATLLLGLLGCQRSQAQVPRGEVEFGFSPDPTTPVLAMLASSSLTGAKFKYSLYGDGRFEVKKLNEHGGAMEPLEIALTYQETENLVRMAVEHGLAELKVDGLLQDLRQRAGETSLHVGEDLGDTTFEIRIATYRKNGQEFGPIENIIRLRAPGILYAMFPDIEELEGMAEITRRFQELRASMQKSKLAKGASDDSP